MFSALIRNRVALRAAYDRAAHHADYRRMFDAHRELDAVLIATPDHHHAGAAKMPMERGLHVYVQKPLTYTIAESRMLAGIARNNPRLVTQMGNQGHSGDDGRRVIELIRGGVIGNVREGQAWTNRPVWPQGIARPAAVPAPASLDWDIWMGPATVGWGYNLTPISTGAAGPHSAPGRWATWARIFSTFRSGHSRPACRHGSRRAIPPGVATTICGTTSHPPNSAAIR